MTTDEEKPQISEYEVEELKLYYAKRWLDPINKIEDIFNVRRSDGSLTKLYVPEPQRQMIRDGILGKSRQLVGSGISYLSVTDKGRQLGFSVILAAEAILIAEDFPNTKIYYVATSRDQALDWMGKVNQMIEDANHWPDELGGGPILNIGKVDKVFEKVINNTSIIGVPANQSAIRGKTGIHVIFDEAAWAIRIKDLANDIWKALKYIIRQGGSARIQSTPRTSDTEEFFWGMYSKGEKGALAIHTYDCPVIENWKELDLEEPLWIDLNNERRELRGLAPIEEEEKDKLKQKYKDRDNFIVTDEYIKQDAKIPYWWVSIEDLETDRGSDLEQFKQENLGIPLDETYKLIKSEWIYANLNEGEAIETRGTSKNPFYILIDFAQKNDITAITVVEKIDNVYVERNIIETQDTYTGQRDMIFDQIVNYNPEVVSFDYTGHGVPIYDMLVEKVRNAGYNPNILKKVTFTMNSKEAMAVGFRNLVMPDALSGGKSRYRWLNNTKEEQNAIRHCLRVEKEMLPQGGIRYSGKMHGRDDHFWSKAQIALLETPTGGAKAAFGKTQVKSAVGDSTRKKKTLGNQILDERNKQRMQEMDDDVERKEKEKKYKSMLERARHAKNVKFAIQCLANGIILCRTLHKPVKPLHCANPYNCTDPNCPGYKYVEEICQRYDTDRNEIWRNQRVYQRKREEMQKE